MEQFCKSGINKFDVKCKGQVLQKLQKLDYHFAKCK